MAFSFFVPSPTHPYFLPAQRPLNQSPPPLPKCNRQSRLSHRTITMLNVQKSRQPEDWEKKKSSLSGRFLPLDPRDETVLDVLEQNSPYRPFISPRTPSIGGRHEEGHDDEMDGIPSAAPRKWSKRSEAARKRWSNPEYRAKMLEKRAKRRLEKEEAQRKLNGNQEEEKKNIEIGCMDSITLSNDERAKKINAYARSNQLRSEKATAFHRNRRVWMEKRLQDSPQNLSDEQYIEKKLQMRERRRQAAFKRADMRRAKLQQNNVENAPSDSSKAKKKKDDGKKKL